MRLLVLLMSLCFFAPQFAFAEGHGSEEKPDGTGVAYVEVAPKFTINLVNSKKYLAINVQLLVEDETVHVIKKHMPALKHELIMLFSGRTFEALQTIEQREALRQETIATVHKLIEKLENEESSRGLIDIFFTEFLFQ